MGSVVGIGRRVTSLGRRAMSDENGTDCCCGGGGGPIECCSCCSECLDTYAVEWRDIQVKRIVGFPFEAVLKFTGTMTRVTQTWGAASCTYLAILDTVEMEILNTDTSACPPDTICTYTWPFPGQATTLTIECIGEDPGNIIVVAYDFGTTPPSSVCDGCLSYLWLNLNLTSFFGQWTATDVLQCPPAYDPADLLSGFASPLQGQIQLVFKGVLTIS